jgi:hypothetical protein
VTRDVGTNAQHIPAAGPPHFELERFDATPVSPGHALLWVSGRWSSEPPAAFAAPALMLVADGRQEAFAPLDRQEATIIARPRGEVWRAGYPVPATVLARRGARFTLEVAGVAVELPAPAEHPLPAGDAVAALRRQLEETGAQLAAATDARDQLEVRLGQAERRVLDAERRARRARMQAAETADTMDAGIELQAAELLARYEAGEGLLDEAAATAWAARSEAEELRARLGGDAPRGIQPRDR